MAHTCLKPALATAEQRDMQHPETVQLSKKKQTRIHITTSKCIFKTTSNDKSAIFVGKHQKRIGCEYQHNIQIRLPHIWK